MKARNGRMLESNKQDLQNVLIRWADGSDAESMARVHIREVDSERDGAGSGEI